MKATTVMLVAIGVAVLGEWANNKPITIPKVVEAMFAVVVIALLDHEPTDDVAKGFAWLFLVAVLLGKNSPINGIAKAAGLQPKNVQGGVQLL